MQDYLSEVYKNGNKTMVAKTAGQRIPSYPSEDGLNDESKRKREHLVAPHVESFNYFLDNGIHDIIKEMSTMNIKIDDHYYITLQYESVNVSYPSKKVDSADDKLTPREARERDISYSGSLVCAIKVRIFTRSEGDEEFDSIEMTLNVRYGDLPIMVMSNKCNIHNYSMKQLLAAKEEPHEVGGYFIVNGIERCVRLLQVPRRNYCMAIDRNSYKKRGPNYSEKGVAIRCVRADQSSATLTLHYLTNGGATLRFVLRKQEFLLPVILIIKSLSNISDKEFFDRVIQGDINNTFMTTRVELILYEAKKYHIQSSQQAKSYLGSLFRMYLPLDDRFSDEDCGNYLIEKYFFIHLNNLNEKLDVLIHMIRKLYSYAENKCIADNADAIMNHELLLPGHLIIMYIKEKLEDSNTVVSAGQNLLKVLY